MTETAYTGQCHCGAIAYEYKTTTPPEQWSIRACQCRFCRAHEALSTSDPHGHIAFTASDESQLQRYRFALRTADFLLCRRCGVYIGAVIETDTGRFGIANTRSLESVPANMPSAAPINYANEDSSSRIARREVHWTPVTGVPW